MPSIYKQDEVHSKPKKILVHNPAVSGVLDVIDRSNHIDLLFPLPPNSKLAAEEHLKLTALIKSQGIEVIDFFELLSKEDKTKLSHNPNIIFTRDPMITLPWLPDIAIVSRMNKSVRQYEPTAFEHIAGQLHLRELIHLPDDTELEGGDVVPVFVNDKRVLIIRTGGRSDSKAVSFLLNHKASLCDAILEVHCDYKTLHLDSVMGLCGENIIVYDKRSVRRCTLHSMQGSETFDADDFLHGAGFKIIPVSFDEADRLQATNFVNIGPNTIIAYGGCRRIIRELEASGINVLSFDGDELAKGRGGPRCLTRPIY